MCLEQYSLHSHYMVEVVIIDASMMLAIAALTLIGSLQIDPLLLLHLPRRLRHRRHPGLHPGHLKTHPCLESEKVETKEDGSLHVYWKDWEVADMVSGLSMFCVLRVRMGGGWMDRRSFAHGVCRCAAYRRRWSSRMSAVSIWRGTISHELAGPRRTQDSRQPRNFWCSPFPNPSPPPSL